MSEKSKAVVRPDKATIHDVFTPAITISVVNVSHSTGLSQLLVVTTERPRCHVAKKHHRVDAKQSISQSFYLPNRPIVNSIQYTNRVMWWVQLGKLISPFPKIKPK